MGGERLQNYWSSEMKSLLESYHQFEELIPAKKGRGAGHHGENGRYIESILKETLKKFLPAGVEIFSGFILRAGVKSEFSGVKRKKDADRHSSQLDIIVYDIQNYPVYQRFGDTAVVLPEGVLGIISVKKTLYQKDFSHEVEMLLKAAQLCVFKGRKGPFLALVGMDDYAGGNIEKVSGKVFEAISAAIRPENPKCYDGMPGFVGNLQKWTIHKVNKGTKQCAEFQVYVHDDGEEHLGLQFLIKGILDVYYSEGRNHGQQPGYISFPSGKQYEGRVLEVAYDKK